METNEKKNPQEEMIELRQKIMQKGLVINRVPQKIKTNFLALAASEFEDDYGMALKSIFEEAMEYRKLKDLFFMNLEQIEDIKTKILQIENQVLQMNQPKTDEKKGVKLMNGKILGGNEK